LSTHLDKKTLRDMSVLAALPYEPNQSMETLAALNEVLELVSALEAVEVDNVPPLAHPLERFQSLTPDQVTETVDSEALSQNAPNFEDGLYFVPRVIE